MNSLQMARTAYASVAAPVKTTRSTEYDAFARITAKMKSAANRGRAGFPDLVSAIYDNNRLWVILATDVADDANELPKSLRAQIFYLAEFSLQFAPKVLNGEETPDALIDINTTIMRGLRQQESGL